MPDTETSTEAKTELGKITSFSERKDQIQH